MNSVQFGMQYYAIQFKPSLSDAQVGQKVGEWRAQLPQHSGMGTWHAAPAEGGYLRSIVFWEEGDDTTHLPSPEERIREAKKSGRFQVVG